RRPPDSGWRNATISSPRDLFGHAHMPRTERERRRPPGLTLAEEQDRSADKRQAQTGRAELFVRRVGFIEPWNVAVAVVEKRINPDRHASNEQCRAGPE